MLSPIAGVFSYSTMYVILVFMYMHSLTCIIIPDIICTDIGQLDLKFFEPMVIISGKEDTDTI